ncbi:hypothetical protein ABID22_001197 [Pontibacter aydingkolensis]|uniref:Uncharacterized protein n=1 Tax=Pontibacter aydingkolensis TaxID=1911536 RepID=A0ABS7CTC0_9BACT|nr:hypothetical protein [Pontibacter aydingkolensis]MBW7467103.1 hypothetical protein [Pontibacter aydingkolensis]
MKDYSYGLVIDSPGGNKRISHTGAINGFKANFMRFPEHEMVITILSNYESQQVNGPISKDVQAIVLGKSLKYQLCELMLHNLPDTLESTRLLQKCLSL